MLELDESCLDRWIGSFEEFRLDFLRYSQVFSKAVGYWFEFDQAKLQLAHENWHAKCGLWKAEYTQPSNGLSHIKMMAILMNELSAVGWVRHIVEFDRADSKYQFTGSELQLEEARADLNAGREAYFAFQFCLLVIIWFEEARSDKSTPFVLTLTRDLKHDILVYLHSEIRDEKSLFLILKALFARH